MHIHALGEFFAKNCLLEPYITLTRGHFLLNQQHYQTFKLLVVKKKHPHIRLHVQRMICFTCNVCWVKILKATNHKVGKDHMHLKAMIFIKKQSHSTSIYSHLVLHFLQVISIAMTMEEQIMKHKNEYYCHLQLQNQLNSENVCMLTK